MGKILHCDHSRVWKIENNRLPMTREVAALCDEALDTGGALVAALSEAQRVIKPAQLPAAPARLVGREAELAVLTAGVRDQPQGTPAVVAIDGPAGVGKTALALRWAHQVAGRYVDGQLYADMRAFAPRDGRDQVTVHGILEEFLSAMGVGAVPTTTEQRASLFRSLTASRKVLVVLDNVAGLDDIAPLLPASAGCGVVVTSRRALSSLVGQLGATRVTLRPLAEPDAIALVGDLIGTSRADAERAAVTKLTRLSGHLPMALHAAAEQIAIYPHRLVAGLVDDLAEDEHRLSIGETTNLATVFSWSYRDLDPGAARVFRLLGLHHGDHLSMAAVAALAGITVPFARRLLHPLAALHLIDIDRHGVVRLSDPLLSYARELVAAEDTDSERSAAAQRLVTWYVHTAHAAHRAITGAIHEDGLPPPLSTVDGGHALDFVDREAVLEWRDAEETNFGPVTTLALDYGPAGAARQLATALESLGLLNRSQGDADLDHGSSADRGVAPPRMVSDRLRTVDNRVDNVARHQGDQQENREHADETPELLTAGHILAAAFATSHHNRDPDGQPDGDQDNRDWHYDGQDDDSGGDDGGGDASADHPGPPWAQCLRLR